MKTLSIAGNIGKDAETRTSGDTTVTSWSVAVEERKGQEKATMWFDCSLWGQRGKSLEQYLTKGSKVSLSGDFGTREHNGKTYLTIRVDQVTLMGGKPADDRQSSASRASMDAQRPPAQAMDDEIPF